MADMVGNFILETANAPGTATTVNLAGPATGRMSFSQKFSTGNPIYYFMDDGAQAEWGRGTFTSGSPNTISRTTVIGNTAGTTAKLNFAGTTRVYSEFPAEKVCYIDQFTQSVANPGYITLPGGLIIQSGSTVVTLASNNATFSFPLTFPTAAFTCVVSNGDANNLSPVYSYDGTYPTASAMRIWTPSIVSGSFRVNWIATGH